jgi:hypothetical protein
VQVDDQHVRLQGDGHADGLPPVTGRPDDVDAVNRGVSLFARRAQSGIRTTAAA